MKFNKYVKLSALGLNLSLIGLSLASMSLLAASEEMHPKNFITKNYTSYQSNAKVKNVWSPFPTGAASSPISPSVRQVPWVGLKLLCGFTATECYAQLYMKTDTNTPVFVGEGRMNLKTGEITPKEMVNNGFQVTSPEPGVIELREVAAPK